MFGRAHRRGRDSTEGGKYMQDRSRLILAVDIGGSKVASGFVDSDGNASHIGKFLWDSYETLHVLERLSETVRRLLSAAPRQPDAIGFTIPGLADPARGMWLGASYMGIHNIPLKASMEQEFGIPVFLENDTNACCLAEKLFGRAKDCDDFLYLTVSNGVGGAFFLDGKLYYGAHGFAGEYGMCVVKEGGVRLENDRIAGSLEMYASGRGIVRNYLEAGGSEYIDGKPASGIGISAMAERGEPAALRAFELEGYYIGKVIAAACNLLDPALVIIGGGLSLAFDKFFPSLDSTMKKEHYQLERYRDLLDIVPTALGYNSGLYGAAAAALLGLETDASKKLGYRG